MICRCQRQLLLPSPNICHRLGRQARQNPLQLAQHNRLISSRRVPLGARTANTDTSITPTRARDLALSRQSRRTTSRHISRSPRSSRVDPAEHKLELVCVVAARRRARGEVDVQVDTGWQVGSAGLEEDLRYVEGEVGVDGGVVGYGRRVGDLRATAAAEGDGGNTLFDGFGRGADCAGQERSQTQVSWDMSVFVCAQSKVGS